MSGFKDIPSGVKLLLDANTVIYHFIAEPTYGSACTSLLQRVQSGEIGALLPMHFVGEVAHRLMTLEVCQKFGWPYAGIARRLRQHPQQVGQLQQYEQALQALGTSGVVLVPVTFADCVNAAQVSRATGLLTNDSIAITIMRQNGLTLLASNDADFDRVPGITRFAPV